MTKLLKFLVILMLVSMSCSTASTQTPQPAPLTEEIVQPEIPSSTFPPVSPTETFTAIPSTETSTPTATPIPAVESLKAQVTADLLSCRYGPGAEYLYLYGLRKTANIELIGRTDGNNWVLVKGKSLCWVNTKFLEIDGDPQTLKIMYPDGYKIPVSPYYSSPTAYSAERDPNNPDMVTAYWSEMTLRAGDEEDESMFIYIIEVWRCEGGQIIFDPLASNYPEVTFVDEAGCSEPSHGRVFFQEKHGFAGPSEIPWPAR